jgi:D-isomer specific 2-hydroxyacid dehydrogenase, NAD binding domain
MHMREVSPLHSNVVLDELDRELARRGHRFARHADGGKVYVRSERAGQRVMASLTEFIEGRLRLKVNRDKSAVARPEDRHFLGFRLRLSPQTGRVEVLLSERTKRKAMERIPQLTPRKLGEQSWRLHLPDQRVAARVTRPLRDRLRHGDGGDGSVGAGDLLLDYPRLRVNRLQYNAGPTAEMAVALLLAAAKNLVVADREMRDRRWRTDLPLRLLDGSTAVILGQGAVGSRVAALCRGLGMKVAGICRCARSGLSVGESLADRGLDLLVPARPLIQDL